MAILRAVVVECSGLKPCCFSGSLGLVRIFIFTMGERSAISLMF